MPLSSPTVFFCHRHYRVIFLFVILYFGGVGICGNAKCGLLRWKMFCPGKHYVFEHPVCFISSFCSFLLSPTPHPPHFPLFPRPRNAEKAPGKKSPKKRKRPITIPRRENPKRFEIQIHHLVMFFEIRFSSRKNPFAERRQLLRKFPKSLSKSAVFPVTQRNLLFLHFFAASQIVASFHETMPLQKGEQTRIISLLYVRNAGIWGGRVKRVEHGTHENSSFIVFSPSLFSQQTKKRIFLPIFVAVQWTSAKYFDNYVSWANDALFGQICTYRAFPPFPTPAGAKKRIQKRS